MKYVLCVFSPARKKLKTDILLRVEVPKSTWMMVAKEVTDNFNKIALQFIFAHLFCY